MQSLNWRRHWSVILAGGDGERLRPLTRLIAGDDRPKQFCPLLGGKKTLLEQTQLRIAKAVPSGQTLYVLTRRHERFYADGLAQIPPSRMIVQQGNRGTLPAILSSLARLIQLTGQGLDGHAVVGFFPSDHYYSRERRFIKGVRAAFEAAESNSSSVILLGAEARIPGHDFWLHRAGGRDRGTREPAAYAGGTILGETFARSRPQPAESRLPLEHLRDGGAVARFSRPD